MSASRTRLVILGWLLAMSVFAAGAWVSITLGLVPPSPLEMAWAIGFAGGFTTVGVIIIIRRPAEPVGRICLAAGLALVGAIVLRGLSVLLDRVPGAIPDVGAILALASGALMPLALLYAGGYLVARFPSGRDHGLLAAAADLAAAVCVVGVVVPVFAPGDLSAEWLLPVENPLGIPAIGPRLADALSNATVVAYAICLGLGSAILVRRYRRAGKIERAQIRWVAAAGVLPVVLLAAMLAGGLDLLWALWVGSTGLMPIAIGIAILRYRLYDIDRLVGRTVSYALITALLAAVFLAMDLALQATLVETTGGSTVTVAASTLVAAALFQPLRRAIQAPIDRRFNRAHVDAQRIIGDFVGGLRDELDLAALDRQVLITVDAAAQPRGAAVWIRGGATGRCCGLRGGRSAPDDARNASRTPGRDRQRPNPTTGDLMSWSMESVHEADVTPADVYRCYLDPDTPERWAHNTSWGRARSRMEAGALVDVRVRSHPWTYTVRVRELEPGRRLVSEVRPFGVTITSTYEVTAVGSGARLPHTISLQGPLQRAYRLVRGQYTRMLQAETRRVAELAAGDRRGAAG